MIAGVAQRNRLVYNLGMRRKNGTFGVGTEPWNKNTKGVMKSNKTSFKKGDNSRPLKERFEEKFVKGEKCWVWMAHKNNKGYGVIHVNGGNLLAHRVAYQHTIGEIPEGLMVMHICDNPACVNPSHLILGTQLENMRDMDKKGRRIKGDKASWSKLNSVQVAQIRKLYVQGGISMRALGKQFKISYTVINHIIRKKLWK